MEKIHKQLQRYGFRKFGSRPPARPNRDDNTLQPGGLTGKKRSTQGARMARDSFA